MGKKLIKIMTFICAFVFGLSVPVQAAKNMVPNYEIKCLLNSAAVLDEAHQLDENYRSYFNTGNGYQTIGTLYIETADREFDAEGWYNRIRIKEGSNKFDLTYKKRYSISGGDIDAALTQANEEGFDIKDTNYEAQVDWGYSKMTLSLSNKKEVSNSGYDDLELPKKSKAIKILQDNMPGKEQNWLYKNWGEDLIEKGKKCGPIYYKKYSGTVNGIDVDIEIWPITYSGSGTTEYITELSFKEDTYSAAASNRQIIMNILDGKGILLHEDSLKTQKILNAFL